MSKNNPILPQTIPADTALDIAVRVVRNSSLRSAFLAFDKARWHNADMRDIYIPSLDMVVERVARTFACLIRREVGEKKFGRIRSANRTIRAKDNQIPINGRCASNAFTDPNHLMGEAIKEVMGRTIAEGDEAEIVMLHIWPRAWRSANLV